MSRSLAMAKPYEYYHGGLTRPEVVRANYRAWSRQGQTRAWMLKNITNVDGRVDADEYFWMDEHVSQMFWQMVRKLLRLAPRFGQMLEFNANFYEKDQEQILEHIRKVHWASMQQIDDDRSHTVIYRHVERLYNDAKEQLRGARPTPEVEAEGRRQKAQQIRLNERRLRRQRETGEYLPPVPQPWELDSDDELIPDRQQVYDRDEW